MSPDTTPPAPTATDAPLVVGTDGWLALGPGIQHHLSPNHDARPAGLPVSLLVIHNISLPPGVFDGNAIIDFFCNRLDFDRHPWFESIRGMRVSAHFLIRRSGSVVQFVPTTQRAWHAGVSVHQGRERCNDFSIGIELEGTDHQPYTDAQYQRLIALTQALEKRHPLTDVCGHQHIAPGRKTDPGPAFDWARYGKSPLAGA